MSKSVISVTFNSETPHKCVVLEKWPEGNYSYLILKQDAEFVPFNTEISRSEIRKIPIKFRNIFFGGYRAEESWI